MTDIKIENIREQSWSLYTWLTTGSCWWGWPLHSSVLHRE